MLSIQHDFCHQNNWKLRTLKSDFNSWELGIERSSNLLLQVGNSGLFLELQRHRNLTLFFPPEFPVILDAPSIHRMPDFDDKICSRRTCSSEHSKCPCFYMFSKKSLHWSMFFLMERRKPVYIHQISGRFDVGNLASYL
ncbi:unnamed protein product [Oncorhynchus mykiss]|uniref:Uncharacterized protein n=1 Tax=Oncorhynchus mykiss TaxID=8022 RepID=A0A060VWG1_ONCMY|nr:unnamed protein product [Oncorhynchus mykiss]